MVGFNMRIGHGYDIHQLTSGDHISLGGVEITCPYEIVAHSDGDVVIHAICDAMLGAAALGDIGQHFSDEDDANKNCDSKHFLQHIDSLIKKQGYKVGNIDVTIIAETPKLSPHIQNMRASLTTVLGIELQQINIKATTNEKLDSIGANQAIACHAVLLLQDKNET